MRLPTCIATLTALLLITPVAAKDLGLCRFDPVQLKFAGAPTEQASCLLRRVNKGAELEDNPAVLPAPLNTLIGTPVAVSKQKLRAYLSAKGVSESAIGGSLDKPVSRAKSNNPAAPLARYFVIHDTSTPNCSKKQNKCAELGKLPANRDEASWRFNDQNLIIKSKGDPVAHVFVARTGISKTGHDFGVPWRAVRLESVTPNIPAKGLFLHIENVQPRVGEPEIPPPGQKVNDRIAPDPGFTAAQYKRLALVYVAASLRRGEWLIPGFHAVIDSGISGAHDDPQNFDLGVWAAALKGILDELQ
jgi:hypothetical protein